MVLKGMYVFNFFLERGEGSALGKSKGPRFATIFNLNVSRPTCIQAFVCVLLNVVTTISSASSLPSDSPLLEHYVVAQSQGMQSPSMLCNGISENCQVPQRRDILMKSHLAKILLASDCDQRSQ